jgi:formylglycine-generating enzyme required for sulfatase activity
LFSWIFYDNTKLTHFSMPRIAKNHYELYNLSVGGKKVTFTKRTIFLFILLLSVSFLYTQQKYALVIGNGNYTGISRLNNPVNDANDMEAALRELGFTVDKVLNGSLTDMENAIIWLKNRLSVTQNSYGFLFYAGHGVQSNGVNYLIPVGANIPSENYLRSRAVSVQAMMDELNDAGNELNIVVLDACRDNPFGWARSGSRGLTVISGAPAGSIIMYATGANSVAADGTGRNGLFTGQLLANLRTPGLSVQDVFNKTGADVQRVSNGTQHPELSVRYFGASSVYLGSRPATTPAVVTPQPQPTPTPASTISNVTVNPGTITVNRGSTQQFSASVTGTNSPSQTVTWAVTGATAGTSISPNGLLTVGPNQSPGTLTVRATSTTNTTISGTAIITVPTPPSQPAPVATASAVMPAMVRINGGTFIMGSPANEPERRDTEVQHSVAVSTFYMGNYEVTQKEYQEMMGTNPSNFKGDNLPVENVSWFDAVEYCNTLSQREGLTPAYLISGSGDYRTVTWNRSANGYRLPTEAEWEYACRAGTTTAYNTGPSASDNTGWYGANSGIRTHPVGQKPANAWGLYDMHGNVCEWCWDRSGNYSSEPQTDPTGPSSGSNRVRRGGTYSDPARYVRSAYRLDNIPSVRSGLIGFRIVRNG